LLGITGSIAAYKANNLVRLFMKAGAEVKLVMTPAAKDFVSPLTLSTLAKNPVLSDLADGDQWANHVMLGRWADLMLIAPLSCNTLAKMANGYCDNLLLATYLSATCPVIVAPAMDEDMWHHPATRFNLQRIAGFGNQVIPVESGELASGLYGEGRMAEPEQILQYVMDYFAGAQALAGRKALVTAGPTYEPIDPVRFIGNQSTGKMGLAIAKELHERGADVTLVMGPSQLELPKNGIRVMRVTTAAEMLAACEEVFPTADIAVMSAAVADYTPAVTATDKIKKGDENMNLELVRTRDILKTLGEKKSDRQVLVGFALETSAERENALGKLTGKKADMIVLNSLRDPGAGFGYDSNKVSIFTRNGDILDFETKSKAEVARDIVDTIIRFKYA